MGWKNDWRQVESCACVLFIPAFMLHVFCTSAKRKLLLSSQSSSRLFYMLSTLDQRSGYARWESTPQELQSKKRQLSLSHESIKLKSQVSKDEGKVEVTFAAQLPVEMTAIKDRGMQETRTSCWKKGCCKEAGQVGQNWISAGMKTGACLRLILETPPISTYCGQFPKSPT